MNPRELRDYLHNLERFGIKLGLDQIRTLLGAFGDPHLSFPVVHVAGTNGKGSVCAMLAEALKRAGWTVGLYTSPHLVRVEERIRVNGRIIAPKDFRRVIGGIRERIEELRGEGRLEVSPTAAGAPGSLRESDSAVLAHGVIPRASGEPKAHPLTFFEVLTAAALLYFRERNVDIAVLEVGMGGRFDATNVVTPLVSVITNIALDHQEYLGRTLGAIAFEKAGIIKPGVPVVTGVEGGPALKVIRSRATEDGASLTRAFGSEGRLEARGSGAKRRFVYRFRGVEYRFAPKLPGAHQGVNGAVALAALSVLGSVWKPIARRAMIEGIENARWEGRLELVGKKPRLYLDGAHNEAGAAAIRDFIRSDLRARPVLVFAMMRDKAIGRVVHFLFPEARKVILTSIPYARAANPEEILALAGPFRKKIAVEPSLKRAVALGCREAGPRGVVLVTGSLYLVGAAKKILGS
jgi:dihydrofolate synthase / folylpolyglutamate synthase